MHKVETTWTGDKDGSGEFSTEGGITEGTFTFPTWFEDELGSNPEELIDAAHSGCFSMQLTVLLEGEGYVPASLHTATDVHLDPANSGGFEISCIDLTFDADAPDIDKETFDDLAQCAKENCPVSKALVGPEFTLTATLT